MQPSPPTLEVDQQAPRGAFVAEATLVAGRRSGSNSSIAPNPMRYSRRIQPTPQRDRSAAMETRDRLFIGNEWVAPATDRTIDVISPITEEVYARTPDGSPADIDRAVAAARDAFDNGPWPNSTPDERADAIAALSQALQKRGARDRRRRHQRERVPRLAVDGYAGVRGHDGSRHLRRHRPQLSVERRACRRDGPEGRGAPGTRRRRARGSSRGTCRCTSWR